MTTDSNEAATDPLVSRINPVDVSTHHIGSYRISHNTEGSHLDRKGHPQFQQESMPP